jgi:hypothetical protein
MRVFVSAMIFFVVAFPVFAQGGEDASAYSFLSEQIVVLATIVAAIAALPQLIEFLIDRRKRRERIALSIDDLAIASLDIRLAGCDDLLADIADLIDRAKYPRAYEALKVGNEILIIGPPLAGKKSLAMRIAREAGLERLIIVYNARNADALAEAKRLIGAYRNRKIMLLLPRLDKVDDPDDEEVQTELDALIETTSSMQNVLVAGTAVDFSPGGLLDQMFGIVLVLPGAPVTRGARSDASQEMRSMLASVAGYYLDLAERNGVALDGIDRTAVTTRLTEVARNPADLEDIVVLMQTTALYRARQKQTQTPAITAEIVEKSIRRVIVGAADE